MSDVQIRITVSEEGDAARVDIERPANVDFKHMMCACEYLMAVTASQSNAGFEKALELLCKGATTYRTVGRGKDRQ